MSTQTGNHSFLTLPSLDMRRWSHPIGMRAQLIGRGADCDLQLPDPTVSQQHARIWADDDGQVYIADLNSRNGVRVNGKRLEAEQSALELGDLLRIGIDTWLLLSRSDSWHPPRSPSGAPAIVKEAEPCAKMSVALTINDGGPRQWNVQAALAFATAVNEVCGEDSNSLFADDILGLSWQYQSLFRRGDAALALNEIAAWLQSQTSAVCVAFAARESETSPWRISESATRRDVTASAAPTVRLEELLAEDSLPGDDLKTEDEWSMAVPVDRDGPAMAIYGIWDDSSLRSSVDCGRLIRLGAELAARLTTTDVEATQDGAAPGPEIDKGKPSPQTEAPRRDADNELLRTIAQSDVGILISGETGVGKEYHAREIHRLSGRPGPFIACHCAAIPEALVEDELFGHVKGAFTGANRERRGYFEQAHRGTLFLDEIGDAPPSVQVKLLRAIQDNRIQRIGDERLIEVDVRVISASHRDLLQMMHDGRFREDLYFRLVGEVIRRPPLRDQSPADLRSLIDQLLAEIACDPQPPQLAEAAYEKLLKHDWPGNIRELQSVISRATRRAKEGVIDAAAIVFQRPGAVVEVESLEAQQKRHALKTLARVNGNKTEAARILGIDRGTLRRRLRSWGVSGVDAT